MLENLNTRKMEGMPKPKEIIGKFQIEELIGYGGMAAVYRATNMELGIERALKFLYLSSDITDRERFLLEAKVCVRLDHPNIVKVFNSYYWKNDIPFVEMELVRGYSLDTLLKEQKTLPVLVSFSMIAIVSQALEYANRQVFTIGDKELRNLIHRDLKPANILISSNGMVKLTDFGLARFDGVTTNTTKGLILGTTPYLAPEQHYEQSASVHSDIYALGVTLYEMIAGERPFPEKGLEDLSQMIAAKRNGKYDRLKEICPEISVSNSAIVDKCLNPDFQKRFPSYGSLRTKLEECIASISKSQPLSIVRLYLKNPLMYNSAEMEKGTYGQKWMGKNFLPGIVIAAFVVLILVSLTLLHGGRFEFIGKKSIVELKSVSAVVDEKNKVNDMVQSTHSQVMNPESIKPVKTINHIVNNQARVVSSDSIGKESVHKALPKLNRLEVARNSFLKGDFHESIRLLTADSSDPTKSSDDEVLLLMESYYRAELIRDAMITGMKKEIDDSQYFLIMALCNVALGRLSQAEQLYNKAIVAPSVYDKSSHGKVLLYRARFFKRKYAAESTEENKKSLINAYETFYRSECKNDSSEACSEARSIINITP